MDPVPTGPLDAEPIEPELEPSKDNVPVATVVPVSYTHLTLPTKVEV